MATIYSTSFLQIQGAAVTQIVGPVPAGHVWVVREIDVFATAGLGGANVQVVGAAGQTWYQQSWATGDSSSHQWKGRVVLTAGESLNVVPSGNIDVTIAGYDLLA